MAEQILNSTQEFYLELIESFEAALLTHGIGQRVAHNVAIKATEQIEFELGGCSIYIPKNCAKNSLLTNAKIISEFMGHNQEELAIKYGYSISNVYKILRHYRASKIEALR